MMGKGSECRVGDGELGQREKASVPSSTMHHGVVVVVSMCDCKRHPCKASCGRLRKGMCWCRKPPWEVALLPLGEKSRWLFKKPFTIFPSSNLK
jgi:hypothetical protein